MNQKGIGVSNIPNLKYRSVCQTGIDFNIMTMGTHGIGKSCFINYLLGKRVLPLHQESDIRVSNLVVNENGFETRLTITEVDNIGDSVNNEDCWVPIIQLIQENYKDYLSKEHQNVRSLIKDKRIHVCFYFLEPHVDYIRPVDLICMKEISKYTNLIPIIGKSDLLNENEKQRTFDFIRQIIELNGITLFEERSPVRGDIKNFIPPFFVIASEEVHYQREYKWGNLNLNALHSNDTFRLIDTLIGKSLIDLIEGTEHFYDRYRAYALSFMFDKKSKKADLLNSELNEKIQEEERMIKEIKSRLMEKKKRYEETGREALQ